jgi:hypothetical protein
MKDESGNMKAEREGHSEGINPVSPFYKPRSNPSFHHSSFIFPLFVFAPMGITP